MKKLFYLMIASALLIILPTIQDAQWVQTNNSVGTSVQSLATDGSNIYAGTQEGTIFVSANNGAAWSSISKGLPQDIQSRNATIRAILISGSTMFAAPENNGLYVSTDHGNNWAHVDGTTFGEHSVFCMIPHGSNLFLGACGCGIFKSSNVGGSWMNCVNCTGILSMVVRGSSLFAGTISAGIITSSDNGITWVPASNGLSSTVHDVFALASCDQALIAGCIGEIYRSTDNGANWTRIYNGIQIGYNQYPTILSLVADGLNVLAGTQGKGVFLSKNNGESWTQFNQGLPDLFTVYSMIMVGSYVYAASYEAGVWKRPVNDIITYVADQYEKLPVNYSLSQNYPNPFNPITTISYSLPRQGYVEICVYDMLGQKVRTLVSEHQVAGNYQIEFDGSNLASGVYFYEIRSSDFSKTKKMVLMK